MKKYFLIVVTMIFIVLLTSCKINELETKDKIIAPENNLPPLQGKWIVEKAIDGPYRKAEKDNLDSLVGKEILFHKDAVIVGEDYTLEPKYKLKNVDLSDYILYKYKINPEDLGIIGEEAQVVTILGNNQYFYEFIKYSDKEMIVFDNDRFYFLNKNIDQISKDEIDRYINVENKIMRISNVQEVDTLRSGVLLGIKSHFYDESMGLDNWEYKTIWMRFNNGSIGSVYEMEDLLLPRKKGFWLVNVRRDENNGTLNDDIKAVQKGKFKEEMLDESTSYFMASASKMRKGNVSPSILKNILYIGNDYVSTEVINKSNNRKMLQVYPVDYLEDEKAISISDIVGDNGLKIFKEDAQSIIQMGSSVLLDEESFGLARRKGYWIMKGRINYNSNEEELYKDYNIKTIPPKELVNYDELAIPWSIIKSKVPEAIDAFTSPNEDIIIVVTRNNLLIYSIHDNEISKQELGKIKIDSSENIVMAEWSTGRYTILWEEEFLKNETQVIKY